MSDLNPFPDYAVARLKMDATLASEATVVTPAISAARNIVDRYADQWLGRISNKDQPIESIITAVRGDYGTGKTHLILDASARLRSKLTEAYPDLKIIRVACRETDPLSWFRLSVGPEFLPPIAPTQLPAATSEASRGGFIERLMLRFYAAAGRTVAAGANLTKGAIDKLTNDPGAIRSLVRENLLNVSAVDEQFSLLLQKTCPEASQNIRRALAATAWVDTAVIALRWLAGKQLNETERNLLRVSQDLSDEEEAANVLLALAAVHRYLDTPFVIMFDELEHLTRYDQSQQSKRNVTWLKRLLEGLAAYQALTFVSGHWSAWEAQNDYLDRFSQLRPIELVKLSPEDVLAVVQQRVSAPGLSTSFGLDQARAIVQNTDGNIRRVLTLCRVLFRNSNGFTRQLSAEEIQVAATELGQRTTPDEAVLRARTIVEQLGMTVHMESTTSSGIGFDLIAYRGNDVRVVMDIKHATHQADQLDQAKVFLDKVQEAYKSSPDLIGCFLADGNIDDDLQSLLVASRPFRLLWYDLTKADVMTRLATDLRSGLAAGVPEVNVDANAAQLSAQKIENQELMSQLEDRIKAASTSANADLVSQLEAQRNQLAQLNQQLTRREDELREEFLKNLRAQIEELDQKRSAELRELYMRLESEQAESRSRREEELLKKQADEDAPKLNVTYSELTRPVMTSKKLQIALGGPQLIVILMLVTGGIVLAFTANSLAQGFPLGSRAAYVSVLALLYSASVAMIGGAIVWVWLRVIKVDAFFDYSARTLREIYLRNQSVQELVRADSILRDSLETYGLLAWKRKADDRLWREFGIGEPEYPPPAPAGSNAEYRV